MILQKARIVGFQSFSDSGEIKFEDGINLVIGQNNAGKSALLRALQANFPDDRHRNHLQTDEFRLPIPKVQLTVDVSGPEIRDTLLKTRFAFDVPIRQGWRPDSFFEALFGAPSVIANLEISPHGNFARQSLPYVQSDMLSAPIDPPANGFIRAQANNGTIFYQGPLGGASDTLAQIMKYLWETGTFILLPERYGVGRSTYVHVGRLSSNASNLPAVLATMEGNQTDLFDTLVDHMREVFSTVGNVSIRPDPTGGSQSEILIWPTKTRRGTSFALEKSGTGVAQTLSILTAIMMSEKIVMMIDEVNSFLHPAAAKALLRIIQTNYISNQYIISTHSPDVIGSSNPNVIHLVERKGYESTVKRLELHDVESFRNVADHLGVSMTDVFAADHVIWVEGPTEELCFPYLFDKSAENTRRNFLFVAIAATGDFITNKKTSRLTYEIYHRLTAASVTLTVSVAFSFDSEELSEKDKEDLIRQSSGKIHFLPRRHLECYLVDPDAIAHFIKSSLQNQISVTPGEVLDALISSANGARFKSSPSWNGDICDEEWLKHVDAANLINEVCVNITANRLEFRKKRDSLALLQYLKQNKPRNLSTLIDYVNGLVATENQ